MAETVLKNTFMARRFCAILWVSRSSTTLTPTNRPQTCEVEAGGEDLDGGVEASKNARVKEV
jgi:hypothetical protein